MDQQFLSHSIDFSKIVPFLEIHTHLIVYLKMYASSSQIFDLFLLPVSL